jgi:hypothetical protein
VVPIDKDMALKLSQSPEGVDRAIWLYELCRFLVLKANAIVVGLFSDKPPCSSQTCPEMRASEWQYLCAVHDPPKSCCAIDYCCHTLDWAANTLTSPKHFPSRLSLGSDSNTAHQQIRQLTNIFRRVYRIFAHAWFQHREVFWKVEGKTGLYVFFKTVCDVYGLIPSDNYTVPPEAEGIETTPVMSQKADAGVLEAAKNKEEQQKTKEGEGKDTDHEVMGNITVATGNTTKLHRHTHTRDPSLIPPVIEEHEEVGQLAKELENSKIDDKPDDVEPKPPALSEDAGQEAEKDHEEDPTGEAESKPVEETPALVEEGEADSHEDTIPIASPDTEMDGAFALKERKQDTEATNDDADGKEEDNKVATDGGDDSEVESVIHIQHDKDEGEYQPPETVPDDATVPDATTECETQPIMLESPPATKEVNGH